MGLRLRANSTFSQLPWGREDSPLCELQSCLPNLWRELPGWGSICGRKYSSQRVCNLTLSATIPKLSPFSYDSIQIYNILVRIPNSKAWSELLHGNIDRINYLLDPGIKIHKFMFALWLSATIIHVLVLITICWPV